MTKASGFTKQLEKDNNLKAYEVNAIDRKYNFWQRDSLNIELFTAAVFNQKLNYIHYNPVKTGLCNLPEEYYFSSALFYEKGIDHFGFIEHYLGYTFYNFFIYYVCFFIQLVGCSTNPRPRKGCSDGRSRMYEMTNGGSGCVLADVASTNEG